MLTAVRPTRLGVFLLAWLVLLLPSLAQKSYHEHLTSDGKLLFRTEEDFAKTFNPHALLSLQSDDQIVLLVTSQERRLSITQLYDGLPSSFDDGTECVGRVLLTLDGNDAASFLVEGMFPPEEEATHHTLYVVTNHGETEYTIMIHYPIDMEDKGLEFAASLLDQFSWRDADDSKNRN